MGPGAGLDVLEERKIFDLCPVYPAHSLFFMLSVNLNKNFGKIMHLSCVVLLG